MIGNNCPDAYTPFEVLTGPSGSPHATRTRLGWIVWNIIRENQTLEVNRSYLESCTTDNTKLEEIVKQSINIDFPESVINDKRENSIEDKNFLKQVSESISFEDGHYCVALPFRNHSLQLPNNSTQGLQRLKSLKRKLELNPKFKMDYVEFMDKLLEKGYAEKVPNNEIERKDGRVWYIPHHGIYHSKKPDKIRVVFDCSALYMGISLNNQLLQGPDLTNNLLGVLLKFREEPIAIQADIESMFYQVSVPNKDRDCLRFFWWEDGDLQKDPYTYRMTVHIFGATSSPSCCNYALQQTATDHKDMFDTKVIETVQNNMYVDDCLASVALEQTAISLVQDLSLLCKKGGFRLTKWVSSSNTVLRSVPPEDRAKDVKDLNFERDSLVERALGVHWFVSKDELGFQINMQEQPPTRRGILSVVSSVYDPLGIASPFVMTAKIMLQQLCKDKISWDNEINGVLLKNWNSWLYQTQQLEHVRIDRCYKPANFGNIVSCQLHSFSDASQVGMGIVIYLRLVNVIGQTHCSFVLGKGRVAPLKSTTIPRMELTASTIAVKLAKIVTDQLEYSIDEHYYWTDSMSVLRYIANTSSRFHTFVANRLNVIHAGSNVNQWKYVSTMDNPADCASRGIKTVDKFLDHELWFSGPKFLWNPVTSWPIIPDTVKEPLSDEFEIKKRVNVATVNSSSKTQECMHTLLNYCSDWKQLKRITGWLLLAKDNLLNVVRKNSKTRTELIDSGSSKEKAEEKLTIDRLDRKRNALNEIKNIKMSPIILHKAEETLIRYVQHDHFAQEIDELYSSEKRHVKKSSSISKLDPIVENGLLRVGGRLDRSDLSHESKHPLILPKHSLVSKLILEDAHRTAGHLGKNSTLAVLRQRYWILGASSILKSLISRCVICKRYQSPLLKQKMADLPEERLIAGEPPFTRVGMDYFGPFEVKMGRSVVKRYGVIFTCLNIRAIHLEVAFSLDTDSCINAIRRFISRRGKPKFIRSDNGTNLIGAERELRESIRNWNSDQIHNHMLQRGINWEFNPPSASHFGGIWERLIRSVRKVLFSVMHEQVIRLNDEGLQTLFCEVEAILNGRPLTETPNSVHDLSVLTPNHLLMLRQGDQFPPALFVKTDCYAKRRWRQIQYLADIFWCRWIKEYLPLLQTRQKWLKSERNVKIGDLVLISENSPRCMWNLGRIVEVQYDKHGVTRVAKVKTASTTLTRPIAKLCLVLESDD